MSANNTAIILVHEIYGVNDHIKRYRSCLEELGYDVLCPDLLGMDQPFPYDHDSEAYAHFINNVGFLPPRGERTNQNPGFGF